MKTCSQKEFINRSKSIVPSYAGSGAIEFTTISFLRGIFFVLNLSSLSEKPGPPQNLVRAEVFYDKQKTPNLKVTWNPPEYDGGAVIGHYIVEYKTVKTEWGTANNASVNVTEFVFQVDKSQIYTVRVRAVNRLGAGEPADVINVKLTG